MVISSIYLSQGAYTVPPVIHAVQGDTGRILWMYLTDTDLSSDYDSPYTAGLYFKRSDGTYYSEECMTDPANNHCEAALDQALTQPGVTKCQLKIEDASGICSTFDFNIIVHESTSGVSEEQLGYSLEEIQEIIETAEEIGSAGRLWGAEDVYLLGQLLAHLKYDSATAGTIAEELLTSLENKPTNQGWSMEQINMLDTLLSHVKYTDADGGDYADALIASLRGQTTTYTDADEVEY